MVQVGSQQIQKEVQEFYYNFTLLCGQIWLNLSGDHGHFGYNTKLTLKKRNTDLKSNIRCGDQQSLKSVGWSSVGLVWADAKNRTAIGTPLRKWKVFS
jgi:hypothetical protein